MDGFPCIDIDGVIANTPRVFEEKLAECMGACEFNAYRPTANGTDIPDNILNPVINSVLKNQIKLVTPYDDALKWIPKFQQYFRGIIFLTARRYKFRFLTIEWLNHYFPRCRFLVAHIESREKVKWMQRNDHKFLVEDRLRTANQCAEAGFKVYLIRRKWNRGRYLHKNVRPVMSLHNVLKKELS